MKLEEIQGHWEKDSTINRVELGEESLRIPQLHSKYYKMYSDERMALRKHEYQYTTMKMKKYEYYSGTISQEDLQQYGWEPNPLKLLRSDVAMYVDSDTELLNIQAKIDMQREKVEFIESIIKSLTTRGYQIKCAIEWEKFKVGA